MPSLQTWRESTLILSVLHTRSVPAVGRCLAIAATALIAGTLAVAAQTTRQPPKLGGNYAGALGPLHLNLHLKAVSDGSYSGTLDSVDQGAMGILCSNIKLDGDKLSFSVPAVHGTWTGSVSSDGKKLDGSWNQGSPIPLTFSLQSADSSVIPAFVPAAKPSPIDGFWLGELGAGAGKLRVQVTFKSDSAGKEYGILDSLDQNAMGLECAKMSYSANDLSFDVPDVRGHWSGKLSADGNALIGTWNQGSDQPLNFTRQNSAIAGKPTREIKFDPAAAPVNAADLKSVMDRDLSESLATGELGPQTGAGVSIAVVKNGVRSYLTYGTAKPDSIFEIGSISKTFTGLILAQMVTQGKVKLDEPVRELLPPGTVDKPQGAEITLLELATQHSGLPRMPEDFAPGNGENPYADYLPSNMYAYLKKHGVAKPANAQFLYSNLGFGLLGQALADRAGLTYPELLRLQVTGPLGLNDTVINLSPEQQARFIPGHDGNHKPAHAWDLVAFAGAGAIRSTASDMLAYLEANLHPETAKLIESKAVAGLPAGGTLKAAFKLDHTLHAETMPGTQIALAWFFEAQNGNYWHNGATGGYSSYAFFNAEGNYAGVVLLNTSIGSNGSYADRLGQHISQRLKGDPAISLAD